MIVLSISTIPGREKSLISIVNSIIETQTMKPNIIMINYSDNYPRFKNKEKCNVDIKYINSNIIKSDNIRIIYSVNKDDYYFSNLKYVAPFVSEIIFSIINDVVIRINHNDIFNFEDQNSILIACDDDSYLKSDAIELLYNNFIKKNDIAYSIMGCIGIDDNTQHIHSEYVDENIEVDIFGGYRGVGISLKILYSIIEDFYKYYDSIYYLCLNNNTYPIHDDHIISYFLKKHNIKINVVASLQKQQEIDYKFIDNGEDSIFKSEYSTSSYEIISNYLKLLKLM